MLHLAVIFIFIKAVLDDISWLSESESWGGRAMAVLAIVLEILLIGVAIQNLVNGNARIL